MIQSLLSPPLELPTEPPALEPEFVLVERALWASIVDALMLYGTPKNWEAYSHKLAGIIPAPVATIKSDCAKRAYDRLTPELLSLALLPETDAAGQS